MTHVLESPANVAAGVIDALIQANRGDRQAFAWRGRRYSFHDVAALMNRAANLLDAWDVPTGARVLVRVPASPAWAATVLGAMKSARVPLIAPMDLDADAVARLGAEAGPTVGIVHEDVVGSLAALAPAPEGLRLAVVGNDAHGHASFVEALRAQSSWRAAEPVAADAVVLEWWRDGSLFALSREALEGALADDASTTDAAGVVPLLRAFSRGEEAALG